MWRPVTLLFPALLCACSLAAQTYSPKTIRLQGADDMDQAQVMHLIGLQPGAALTKDQIEAAMQRLADSGQFADLSYTVDDSALVFVLKPVAGAQSLPVRYSNFVWWQPGELEPLVEARVPLFHGKLPLTGQLTTQVEDALSSLLAQKGITGARVEAMQSMLDAHTVALRIADPGIELGHIEVTGIAPGAREQMRNIIARISARDFDSAETPSAIVGNTLDTHRNAGYLDAAIDPPVFSPPRSQAQGYVIDATAAVHPGSMYHVRAITFEGVDPKLTEEVTKAAGIKTGDPAEEMTLHIAEGLAARVYEQHGMLEAKAPAQVSKDTSAHTASYTFHVHPGPVYSFASLDVSALSPDLQKRVEAAFHGHPGQVADASLRADLSHAIASAGMAKGINLQQKLNPADHTVQYKVLALIQRRPAQGM